MTLAVARTEVMMMPMMFMAMLLIASSAQQPEPEVEPSGDEEAADPSDVIDPLQEPSPNEQASGLPPGVDLWDDSTWSELTVEQKDKLRAERARRRAGGESGPIDLEARGDVPDDPPVAQPPRVDLPHPSRARAGTRGLERYWEDKHLTLRRSTIGFSVMWGASLVGGGVLAGVAGRDVEENGPSDMSSGAGSSATVSSSGPGAGIVIGAALVGIIGAVGMVGTIVSASMLGAHNNAKPLYFAAGGDGLTLRF
jgi:hypothetical protein